jgi:sensor histidine kinase YesM
MEDKEQVSSYKRKLRSVLIHKPMQREFTLVVISLLIISALAVGFVIHYTIREAMMGGGYRFGKISPYEVMSEVSYDLIVRVSTVLFVTLLIIAIFGIFFLHRIAGPVYRFRGVLRRIIKGEIPQEFKLRDGDYFTETAEDLNHLLQMLNEKRLGVENLQRRLSELLQKNPSSPLSRELSEIKETVNKLA